MSDTPQPTFEESLLHLEKLVQSLEAGEVPLDELVAKYEHGCKLIKTCEGRLKAAELKIEQLRDSAGNSTNHDWKPEGEP